MEKYMISRKPCLKKNEIVRSYKRARGSLTASDYLFPCDFEVWEDED